MAIDKFSAVWVSHSSISDYLKCPRAYYLNNVYRDKQTGHKITIMNPSLALGQAVHEVIESLSVLATDVRFKEPLMLKLERAWKKVTGEKGGFPSAEVERTFKQRAEAIITRVLNHPGVLKNLAVKINMDLPHYTLSETDGIILCGKIDWLEYLPDQDAVHIIDFKTSKQDEDPNSLQLPIYYLLAANCQKRPIAKASYWYIERQDEPIEKPLPDAEEATERVLKIAKEIKLARKLERFQCKHNGCFACKPLEAVVNGKAKFVGVNEYRQDMYVLAEADQGVQESVIL